MDKNPNFQFGGQWSGIHDGGINFKNMKAVGYTTYVNGDNTAGVSGS